MPYGCGTHVAFWLCGNHWPYDGEIDIVEGEYVYPLIRWEGGRGKQNVLHPPPPPPSF